MSNVPHAGRLWDEADDYPASGADFFGESGAFLGIDIANCILSSCITASAGRRTGSAKKGLTDADVGCAHHRIAPS